MTGIHMESSRNSCCFPYISTFGGTYILYIPYNEHYYIYNTLKIQYPTSTLLSPHIPHGFHMEWGSFCMDWSLFHMEWGSFCLEWGFIMCLQAHECLTSET